jgi:hypothetical protein
MSSITTLATYKHNTLAKLLYLERPTSSSLAGQLSLLGWSQQPAAAASQSGHNIGRDAEKKGSVITESNHIERNL